MLGLSVIGMGCYVWRAGAGYDRVTQGKVSDFRGESRYGARGNSVEASGGGSMGHKRDPFMGSSCDP